MTGLLPVVLAGAAAAVLAGPPPASRLGLLVPRAEPVLVPWRRPWTARLLVAAAVAFVLGPVAAVLALLLALACGQAWSRRRGARARDEERASAAEVLAVLGAELRAGRQPPDALEAAAGVALGPLAATLGAAATGARVGGDPGATLLRSAGTSAVPDLLRGLAACWQVCGTTGSSLAAAVDRLADALRAEGVQRLAVDAELAGPRATALLLAVLPLAGIALAAGLGARPVHVLLDTPLGLGCLAGGLGLDLLGLWWTERIVVAAGGVR